jgi:hypothetical protein
LIALQSRYEKGTFEDALDFLRFLAQKIKRIQKSPTENEGAKRPMLHALHN